MNAPFPQSLLDVLTEHPERIAFEHGDRRVTNGQLLSLVRELVAGFDAENIGPGRAVAMTTSVTPEAFAAYLAAFVVGTRVVGVAPGYAPAQRAHVLAADIDVVLTDSSLDELRAHGEADPEPRGKPDDVARLVFTSGSTGLPKGCMQTYASMTARSFWQPDRWTPEVAALAAAGSRYLCAGTLASPVIFDQVVLSLLGGGTAVIPTGDLSRLLPYGIEKYRISSAILPVSRVNAILSVLRTEQVDLSSLRALTVSGSPVPAHRLAEAIERIGPVMYNLYGQSEAGVIAMLTPAGVREWGADALSTVGRVHPDVEVQARDTEGNPVPRGETGEIFVRGPAMMTGYWHEPELTAEVLIDGWLRTRDLGFLDQNGLLHLVGRSRDVVIVNAQIYYTGPIEATLGRSEDVQEAFVIGAPDDRTGEAIHAFIQPVPGHEPDLAALAELVRDQLGTLSVPANMTIVHDVPQTATGKPDKRALLAAHQS
ncbi:MAG TPA: fatty acid--CoA ligase family protein [Pseudonocardiaceae bacterium]